MLSNDANEAPRSAVDARFLAGNRQRPQVKRSPATTLLLLSPTTADGKADASRRRDRHQRRAADVDEEDQVAEIVFPEPIFGTDPEVQPAASRGVLDRTANHPLVAPSGTTRTMTTVAERIEGPRQPPARSLRQGHVVQPTGGAPPSVSLLATPVHPMSRLRRSSATVSSHFELGNDSGGAMGGGDSTGNVHHSGRPPPMTFLAHPYIPNKFWDDRVEMQFVDYFYVTRKATLAIMLFGVLLIGSSLFMYRGSVYGTARPIVWVCLATWILLGCAIAWLIRAREIVAAAAAPPEDCDNVVVPNGDVRVYSPTAALCDNAVYHEFVLTVTHLIAMVYSVANVLVDCQSKGAASTCDAHNIHQQPVLLVVLVTLVVMCPVRSIIMVPLYVLGTALFFVLYWVPGVPYWGSDAMMPSTVVLVGAEVVVCLATAVIRERRRRTGFERHVERQRRSAEVASIQKHIERVTAAHLPLDVLFPHPRTQRFNRSSVAPPPPTHAVLDASLSATHCAVREVESRCGAVVCIAMHNFQAWSFGHGPGDVVGFVRALHECADQCVRIGLARTNEICENDERRRDDDGGERDRMATDSSDSKATSTSNHRWMTSKRFRVVKSQSLHDEITLLVLPTAEESQQQQISAGRTAIDDSIRNPRRGHSDIKAMSSSSPHSSPKKGGCGVLATEIASAFMQNIRAAVEDCLAEMMWTGEGKVSNAHQLSPVCAVVSSGRCGYFLDEATHNIVAFGPAVKKCNALRNACLKSLAREHAKTTGATVAPHSSNSQSSLTVAEVSGYSGVGEERGSFDTHQSGLLCIDRLKDLHASSASTTKEEAAAVLGEDTSRRCPCRPTDDLVMEGTVVDTPTTAFPESVPNNASRRVSSLLSSEAVSRSTDTLQDGERQEPHRVVGGQKDEGTSDNAHQPPPSIDLGVFEGQELPDSSAMGMFLPPVVAVEESNNVTGVQQGTAQWVLPVVNAFGSGSSGKAPLRWQPLQRHETLSTAPPSVVVDSGDNNNSRPHQATCDGDPNTSHTRRQNDTERNNVGGNIGDSRPSPSSSPDSLEDPQEVDFNTGQQQGHPRETALLSAMARAEERVMLAYHHFLFFEFTDPATEETYTRMKELPELSRYDFFISSCSSLASFLALIVASELSNTGGFPTTPHVTERSGIWWFPWYTHTVLWCVVGVFVLVMSLGVELGAHLRCFGWDKCTVRVLAVYLSQAVYMTAVLLTPRNTVLGSSHTVFIAVCVVWASHRPLNVPALPVILSWDVFIAVVMLLRQLMYLRYPRMLENFFSLIYVVVAWATITTRDYMRRQTFVVEFHLEMLQREIHNDFERLESAMEQFVPAGVAGRMVRRLRRNQWIAARAHEDWMTAMMNTVTSDIPHPWKSGSRNITVAEAPFLIVQLSVGQSKRGTTTPADAVAHVLPHGSTTRSPGATPEADARMRNPLLEQQLQPPEWYGHNSNSNNNAHHVDGGFCGLVDQTKQWQWVAQCVAKHSMSGLQLGQCSGDTLLIVALPTKQVPLDTCSTALFCCAKEIQVAWTQQHSQQRWRTGSSSSGGVGDAGETPLEMLHLSSSARRRASAASARGGGGGSALGSSTLASRLSPWSSLIVSEAPTTVPSLRMLMDCGPLMGAVVGQRQMQFAYFGSSLAAALFTVREVLPAGCNACGVNFLHDAAVNLSDAESWLGQGVAAFLQSTDKSHTSTAHRTAASNPAESAVSRLPLLASRPFGLPTRYFFVGATQARD